MDFNLELAWIPTCSWHGSQPGPGMDLNLSLVWTHGSHPGPVRRTAWTLYGSQPGPCLHGSLPGPCMVPTWHSMDPNQDIIWISIWVQHTGLVVDSNWTQCGCRPGPGVDPNLCPAWISTWALHGSQSGPCMDLNMGLAWISIGDQHNAAWISI